MCNFQVAVLYDCDLSRSRGLCGYGFGSLPHRVSIHNLRQSTIYMMESMHEIRTGCNLVYTDQRWSFPAYLLRYIPTALLLQEDKEYPLTPEQAFPLVHLWKPRNESETVTAGSWYPKAKLVAMPVCTRSRFCDS